MDGISPQAIIEAVFYEQEWMLVLMNRLLTEQKFPSEWESAKIELLLKEKPQEIIVYNTVNDKYAEEILWDITVGADWGKTVSGRRTVWSPI